MLSLVEWIQKHGFAFHDDGLAESAPLGASTSEEHVPSVRLIQSVIDDECSAEELKSELLSLLGNKMDQFHCPKRVLQTCISRLRRVNSDAQLATAVATVGSGVTCRRTTG